MRVVPLAQTACNRGDDPFDCRGSFLWMDLSPLAEGRLRAGLSSSLTASHAHSSSAPAPRPLTAHRPPPNEGCLSLPNCQYANSWSSAHLSPMIVNARWRKLQRIPFTLQCAQAAQW